MTKSIKEWLTHAQVTLENCSETPRLDAELLISHQLKCRREYLYTQSEQSIDHEHLEPLEKMLQARLSGKPMAYIIGKKSFWNFELLVNEYTLIPRADTELAVETALNLIKNKKEPHLFELGTGSGAIACALAYERPDAHIIAGDICPQALAIAKKNQEKLQLNHIQFLLSDWLTAFPKQKADLIISNPPYITDNCLHVEKAVHEHEPHKALYAKENGLSEIKKISKKSFDYLNKDGILLLEIGFEQYNDAAAILANDGYQDIQYALDIHGYRRVIFATR